MKNFAYGVSGLLLLLSLAGCASQKIKDDEVLSIVPHGRIDQRKNRDFKILTARNTPIEIQFDQSGKIISASGNHANEGDTFEPGADLLSLDAISAELANIGHSIKGDWSLNKEKNKWIYEIDGEFQNGDHLRYTVDAKT